MIANMLSYSMRIVIDTSVWISAIITKDSKAREILRLVFKDKLHPQMGETLYKKYESVMKRKKIQKLTPLSNDEQQELLNAFLNSCEWNDIYYSWRPNLKDEDDNFLIELAVASNAKVILTYNEKDFKDAELLFNHRVMTPENFIKEML